MCLTGKIMFIFTSTYSWTVLSLVRLKQVNTVIRKALKNICMPSGEYIFLFLTSNISIVICIHKGAVKCILNCHKRILYIIPGFDIPGI